MKNKLLQPHLMALACLGFNSGFAFILANSTLTMALSFYGFSCQQISLLFLASLPYSLKILWAPILDHYAIPVFSKLLGQRRSWILLAHIGLLLTSLGFTVLPTNINLLLLNMLVFIFFAATQDIVLDAYRIERLIPEELAIGATYSTTGFRVGTLIGGSLPLYLLEKCGWSIAFISAPLLLLLGPIVILVIKEPVGIKIKAKASFPRFTEHVCSILKSFIDFARRSNWYWIILFIFFYKISDSIPNAMRGPLLANLNFTPIEAASISNTYGTILMIFGGFLGGYLATKLGILRSLIFASALQLLSPLGYALLSTYGYNLLLLISITTIQSLAGGICSTALIIYVSSLCKKDGNTATQYSLIYSFGSFARMLLSSVSGVLVSYANWTTFFIMTATLSLPIFFIIQKLKARS